jgi:hypothetical protein
MTKQSDEKESPVIGTEPDFESDLLIDKDALDFEWNRQASLNQKYSEMYANTILDRDNKKDELAVKKAGVDLDIRENWGEWGFTTKPTETAILNTIIQQEEVMKLSTELNELNYEVNRFAGIRGSFEHKKTSLEYLSRLYLGGYWGEPKIPAEAQSKYSEHGRNSHLEDLNNNSRLKGVKHGESE